MGGLSSTSPSCITSVPHVDVYVRVHILKYTDDSRLGGMEHKVVYLVVAMNKPASILWLPMRVREEVRH